MQASLELIGDDIQNVIVAFSGGLDSSVLTRLLVDDPRNLNISLWHINHGLLDVAEQMEAFCIDFAAKLKLEIRIDRINLDNTQGNLEAVSREARYKLFQQGLVAGDCLVTAHHGDDQAETFLLNAFRSSGTSGLRGIAKRLELGEGVLIRPLLNQSRAELDSYAQQQAIDYFEDPSNADDHFDRNFLRNRVFPLIKQRWPSFQNAISKVIGLQVESQMLLDDLAMIDFEQCKDKPAQGLVNLRLDGLMSLSQARCRNLIRYWIKSSNLSSIPHKRLNELIRQLSTSSSSQLKIEMSDYAIQRYHQHLYLTTADRVEVKAGWHEFGTASSIRMSMVNIDLPRIEIFKLLKLEDTGQNIALNFRAETDDDEAVSNSKQTDDKHRLKRLFQQNHVPPWERTLVAQIYIDKTLVGIWFRGQFNG